MLFTFSIKNKNNYIVKKILYITYEQCVILFW